MMLRASKIAFMPALALHSAIPSPNRKPKVSLPSLFGAMREISSPSRSERAGRNNVGGNRQVLAYGGGISEQRVDRYAHRDRRKQSNQRIEGDARGERQQAVGQDFIISPDKNILPAAPGNLQQRAGLPAAAPFCRAPFLQGQRFLRRGSAGENAGGLRLHAIFLKLEGIDYPCRHHHGGTKLGNDFASVCAIVR